MRSGSTWRGSVLFVVSLLVALGVALSTVTVGAAPETTPVSGPPNPLPTPSPGACGAPLGRCGPTFTINPVRGPVGTQVAFTGVCGFRPDGYLTFAFFGVDPLTPATPFAGAGLITYVNVLPPGLAVGRFSGAFAVPSFLANVAVTPGIYFVTGACARSGGDPIVYLATRPFCVSFSEPPRLNPCGSWLFLLGGGLGAQYYFAALFINHIGTEFRGPSPQSPPSPSPDTTPTTRRHVTTTTQPPPATTQPPPTTTTTCVPNPKPPPKVICG